MRRPARKQAPAIKRKQSYLEDQVAKLAVAGEFADAANVAIRRQLDQGISVVVKRGDFVVRWFPDGRIERLLTIEPKTYRLPAGVKIIGPVAGKPIKHR